MEKGKRGFTQKHVPEGITPRFQHWRGSDNVIHATTCKLVRDSDDEVLAEGSALVNPKDNPCKKIGRAISIGRAMKKYTEQRSEQV